MIENNRINKLFGRLQEDLGRAEEMIYEELKIPKKVIPQMHEKEIAFIEVLEPANKEDAELKKRMGTHILGESLSDKVRSIRDRNPITEKQQKALQRRAKVSQIPDNGTIFYEPSFSNRIAERARLGISKVMGEIRIHFNMDLGIHSYQLASSIKDLKKGDFQLVFEAIPNGENF